MKDFICQNCIFSAMRMPPKNLAFSAARALKPTASLRAKKRLKKAVSTARTR